MFLQVLEDITQQPTTDKPHTDGIVGVYLCGPTTSPCLLVLYGEVCYDNDGDDNVGSPVILVLYVRSTTRPKGSCESCEKSRDQPRPTTAHPDVIVGDYF